MTYGLDVVSDQDVLIELFGEALDYIMRVGAPGLCEVDFFPLRELPEDESPFRDTLTRF